MEPFDVKLALNLWCVVCAFFFKANFAMAQKSHSDTFQHAVHQPVWNL